MDKTPKVWLDEDQTENVLKVAKSHSERDYLVLTLCRYGLRIGEILGTGRLPGIFVKDLRDDGVWLVTKGYSHDGEAPSLEPLPSTVVRQVREFIKSQKLRPDSRIFQVGVRNTELRIKDYAREAGIVDWKYVRPHRLRAFFRDGSEGEGIIGIRHSRHDETQEHNDDQQVRRENASDKTSQGHGVAIRRFSFLALLVLAFAYHSYGILSGVYSSLTIVDYDTAIIVGVLEALLVVALTPLFLWKTIVWWHDRPYVQKHVFDDPGLLD